METAKEKETNQWDIRIGELDQYLFGQGTHYDIYKKLGAHPAEIDGKKGVHFAVWAPHAKAVHLTGEFCEWVESPAYEM